MKNVSNTPAGKVTVSLRGIDTSLHDRRPVTPCNNIHTIMWSIDYIVAILEGGNKRNKAMV
jgi:hypothetical protein